MSTPISDVSSPASTSTRAKRHVPADKGTAATLNNRRKTVKVSRACDHCKSKKLRCSGTLPCEVCTQKAIACQYEASYRRGRPPTPPINVGASEVVATPSQEIQTPCSNEDTPFSQTQAPVAIPSTRQDQRRAESDESHGLQTAEIGGQIFDPTSNLTFIHRAWRRLALQSGRKDPGVLTGSEQDQPLMSAGDKPFLVANDQVLIFMDNEASVELFNYYFDSCIVTYRLLNQQNCTLWLDEVLRNVGANLPLHQNIGHAKAAIVVSILAIASLRQHKTSQSPLDSDGPSFLLQQSEHYFITASNLTAHEAGLPRIESVQARVLQTLYLLQTCRMNQAWYVFGGTIPIVSALGLHRKSARNRNGATRSPTSDYIVAECRKRAFWVVYTIDKYLAVVFGRPRFLHDDDVDQDFPDRVNDEDMTSQGPALTEPRMDCHIDSLIFHARVAGIIENISREVYSLKPMSNNERLVSAQRFTRLLHEWREQLPPHLGTVRISSLIPCFGRQATALKLAYCHAIMHANRPFLLDFAGELEEPALSQCVKECVGAARMALETVDRVFCNEKLFFHALWWTPYVTFCALAVVYVWEIQQRTTGKTDYDDPLLFALAEKCQGYLAEAISGESTSKRYSIIIEELRLEARQGLAHSSMRGLEGYQNQQLAPGTECSNETESDAMGFSFGSVFDEQSGSHSPTMFNPLSQWQATDWLDLDSSAFSFFSELEGTLTL